MDEVVPGITENRRRIADVGGSSSDQPRKPADTRAAPVDPVPEITYDEQRYPARPRRLRPRDHLRGSSVRRIRTDPRTANGTNPSYVEWLVRQAMLKDADVLAASSPGSPRCGATPTHAPMRDGPSTPRRVVHGLPDLAHHPAGAVVPGGARATRSCGRRSSASGSPPCTPAR